MEKYRKIEVVLSNPYYDVVNRMYKIYATLPEDV
jgi:hypothetical protein